MNKRIVTIVILIFCLCSLLIITLFIDSNKIKPVDRYLLQAYSGNEERHSYTGEDYSICIEVLDANIYTKDDILLQNQYNIDYFENRCFPDIDYMYADIDFEQMQVDFPVLKTYLDSFKTEGFSSEAEYQSFLDEHLEDYTTYIELDTKYVFVTIEITNDSDVYKEIFASSNQILFVNNNSEILVTDEIIYCDNDADFLDEEDRVHNFTVIGVSPHESKVITLGYAAQIYPQLEYCFSENDEVYLFLPPDNCLYDPRACEKRICLNDFFD